jgi:hypothetical protein
MLILLCDGVPIETASIVEWQTVEFSCLPPADVQLRLLINGDEHEPFLRPGDAAWRWRWNPQNAVGVCEIALVAVWQDGFRQTQRCTLRPARSTPSATRPCSMTCKA